MQTLAAKQPDLSF